MSARRSQQLVQVRLTDSHSHMFGEAVLDHLYPKLKAEVVAAITRTPIVAASKQSREKTKSGRIVWSGKDLNGPLGDALRARGWERRKIFFPDQARYFIDVDFAKGKVAVEMQFGKYAFVQHDFSKFRYLFEERKEELKIDVGIEIVPSARVASLECCKS